ncbi:MAG: uroporphyrinogen-III synthase [Gaiellaceae bacterium]
MTRPRDQAVPLVQRLERLGHEVVACPLIEIEPLGDGPIDLSGYDWLIVTSPNGAREVARRRRGPLPEVVAVGPGTAESLRNEGIEPAFVPSVSTQDGLLAEFSPGGGRIVFAAAEGARKGPIEQLGADFIPLYRTRLLRPSRAPEGDVVTLASGSAARAFAAVTTSIPAVSIGPETTRAARAAGLDVVAEAETHDLDGLVAAVGRIASASC